MPQRLLRIRVPAAQADLVRGLLAAETPTVQVDRVDLEDGVVFEAVLASSDVEGLLDRLERALEPGPACSVVVQRVDAMLPRQEEEADASERKDGRRAFAERVSRAEIEQQVTAMVRLSSTFVLYVVLATVVAAVGLYRDNVAVLVGAMVIAPLLGPNMALALAATLGDLGLARRAMRINGVGLGLALLLAVAFGLAVPCDPLGAEIHARTFVGLSDVVLALASGSAGAVSITAGTSSSLVGVMVAVALMPPLVCVGLLVAGGHWGDAGGAVHLVAVNVVCFNLAAVTTFLLRGLRPAHWWEQARARRAAGTALAIFGALLAVLAALIWLR